MDFQTLIIKAAEALNKLHIPYAVTGGYAVSIWGRLRATFDIDIIIELPKSKVTQLMKALRGISSSGFIDEEMVIHAIEQRDEFQFIHVESGIKIDFWVLSDSSFDKMRIKRRIAKNIEGQKVYFTSPEDLILKKLLWFKESKSTRHLEDIESILRIQENIDYEYLKQWAKRQGTLTIFNDLAKTNMKSSE